MIDPRAEQGGLDAYSAIVTSVAAQLTPRVAALQVRSRRGDSAGSAVVLTGEGHLLTNSHVVGDADSGTAQFADGTTFVVQAPAAFTAEQVLEVAGQVVHTP